ncbi:DNA-directed RNA polymerase subunit H [Candidatus Micrarchaeota archaeon]|nr:DNA-directed RNA polymerase subunit H [Candidatus Micrarchaeota archaeon]
MPGKSAKKKVTQVEAKPIDHVLVPQAEAAADDELAKLAGQGLTRDKLPLIFSTDPAIAFLKLSPGTVVRFTRRSLVTGEEKPFYRLVVEA